MLDRAGDKAPKCRAVRVLVADDHLLVRLGLRAVLAEDPALELVGEARSGQEAVELASRLFPDLVLMDMSMPGMDGLEATSALKRNHPTTSVLILTLHDDADLLLNALRAGAAGYILKTANETDLRAGIREALAGELPIDRHMTRKVLERLAHDQHAPDPTCPTIDRLSAREQEVLTLVTRGYTNRAIAEELIITPHTVKAHVEHILTKLKVDDRTQAAVKAMELGYVTVPRTLEGGRGGYRRSFNHPSICRRCTQLVRLVASDNVVCACGSWGL